MFENLEEVKKHYEEIMENLTIPEVVSDINQYKKLILEQSNLEPVYKAYIAFRKFSKGGGKREGCPFHFG